VPFVVHWADLDQCMARDGKQAAFIISYRLAGDQPES
jgi:hypothetical protein